MENTIRVRRATPEDLEILLQFEQGVIHAERPFDPTLKNDVIFYYDIRQFINSSTTEIVVAVKNDQIVGSGYASIRQAAPYFKHGPYAYLGFMYVDPAHRGEGINQMIMNALFTWVRSKNISELRLNVYEENAAAIRAYEKVGFNKHMVEMRMSLDE